MKRTILTAAAALLLAIPAVQAQKVNKDALLSKIEKSDEAVADAEWVLETFEPRVESDSIASDPAAAFSGDFGMIVNIIQRKEDEDA